MCWAMVGWVGGWGSLFSDCKWEYEVKHDGDDGTASVSVTSAGLGFPVVTGDGRFQLILLLSPFL